MAKNAPKRKPAGSAAAAPSTPSAFPLALTPGEKKISRAAATALNAAYTSIKGLTLTLTTAPARADFAESMQSWWNRNCAEFAGQGKKARAAG